MCEQIPNDDILNRLIFHPGMFDEAGALNALSVFTFSSKGPSSVSVIWQKYCKINCVNDLGCKKQGEDIERKKENKNFDPQYRYSGSIQCRAGEVRSVQSNHGILVIVVHAPQNDQGIHHAEIRLQFSEEKMTINTRKDEIKEIKRRLARVFSSLIPYSCL